MRAGVDGLCSPRPLMETMPLVYRGDDFAERLCASFDDGLAPIFSTLDCLIAYLDPRTAPADMLDWLAGWIGLTAGGHDEPARKRDLIIAGAALLPWRGTVRSVHDAVVAAFDRETEVIESGAATWSTTPNSRPGGRPVPGLTVRVTVDSDDDVDERSLDALVDAVKPAHIPHRVELVRHVPPPPASEDGTPEPPSGDGHQAVEADADDGTAAAESETEARTQVFQIGSSASGDGEKEAEGGDTHALGSGDF